MQQYLIGKNQAGQRFDKYLQKLLPGAPLGFLYKMLRKKNITLNGHKAEGKEILQSDDVVKLFLAEETFEKFGGRGLAGNGPDSGVSVKSYQKAYHDLQGIGVLYEDDDVLILDKPDGILTQKAEENENSLNEWMIGYLLESGSISPEELKLFHPSVCNRLDRNTSGLVLCGKSLAGSQALNEIIRTRGVRKFYRTICVGSILTDGLLKGSLKKDHTANTVAISAEGEQIQTAYHPIRNINGKYTILEVELITGKTHQIRAHMASIGHPVIGDRKYGDPAVNRMLEKRFSLRHQLLHAYRLEFPELDGVLAPLSGKKIIAPCPMLFHTISERID